MIQDFYSFTNAANVYRAKTLKILSEYREIREIKDFGYAFSIYVILLQFPLSLHSTDFNNFFSIFLSDFFL